MFISKVSIVRVEIASITYRVRYDKKGVCQLLILEDKVLRSHHCRSHPLLGNSVINQRDNGHKGL